MLERVGSVKCLLVLLVVCIKGEVIFNEVVKITGLKVSTAWSCTKRLEAEGMIELKRVLTLKGPRTLLLCKEEGSRALKEIKDFIEKLRD